MCEAEEEAREKDEETGRRDDYRSSVDDGSKQQSRGSWLRGQER